MADVLRMGCSEKLSRWAYGLGHLKQHYGHSRGSSSREWGVEWRVVDDEEVKVPLALEIVSKDMGHSSRVASDQRPEIDLRD